LKKALVTGASGFVGAHVVRVLLNQGVSVRTLLRTTSLRQNLSGLDVEIAEGDLTDPSSLKRAVAGCDGLFHVAADYRLAAPNPRELYRNNVDGTRFLLEEALRAGVSDVVYTSSVAAVGHPNGTEAPGAEGDFPDLNTVIGHYKRSKCLAEEVAREYARKGLRVVIVNPSTPIGPYDVKPTPTGRIIVDFLNGRMPAYMETGLNFIGAADVARGHWLAAQKGKSGERYILGNANMMLKEFLSLLSGITGLPAPRIKIPYAVGYCLGAVDTWVSRFMKREPRVPLDGVRMARHLMFFEASRAVRELGLPQTPIREALREAVVWFNVNGYVKHPLVLKATA
jgi:dihydroflavonol-4-reductase